MHAHETMKPCIGHRKCFRLLIHLHIKSLWARGGECLSHGLKFDLGMRFAIIYPCDSIVASCNGTSLPAVLCGSVMSRWKGLCGCKEVDLLSVRVTYVHHIA